MRNKKIILVVLSACAFFVSPSFQGQIRNSKSTLPPLNLNQPVVSVVGQTEIASPDGMWTLTTERVGEVSWLLLSSGSQREGKQLLQIERSAWVLWRPDSCSFALTDAAYADHYLVRIFPVSPRCGKDSLNLDEALRHAFLGSTNSKYEIITFYAKAMAWLSNGQLLVLIRATTSQKTTHPADQEPIQIWVRGYIIDTAKSADRIAREINEETLRAAYPIDKLEW